MVEFGVSGENVNVRPAVTIDEQILLTYRVRWIEYGLLTVTSMLSLSILHT